MWDPADAARRAAAASAATRSITAPAGRLRVHLANHPRDGYAVVHTVDAESPRPEPRTHTVEIRQVKGLRKGM